MYLTSNSTMNIERASRAFGLNIEALSGMTQDLPQQQGAAVSQSGVKVAEPVAGLRLCDGGRTGYRFLAGKYLGQILLSKVFRTNGQPDLEPGGNMSTFSPAHFSTKSAIHF